MDRFKSFKDLCRHAVEGRDFCIEMRPGRSPFTVMAPHGGGIEPGTDVLAAAIAGDGHGYYAFKGIRTFNNAQLHLASERFDEPRALILAGQAKIVVTVHGCRGRRPIVYVGGLAGNLKGGVITTLRKAGFEALDAPGASSLRGVHRTNLCNRGKSGKGVQLELSECLRRLLMAGNDHAIDGNNQFQKFVNAVCRALDRFEGSF